MAPPRIDRRFYGLKVVILPDFMRFCELAWRVLAFLLYYLSSIGHKQGFDYPVRLRSGLKAFPG